MFRRALSSSLERPYRLEKDPTGGEPRKGPGGWRGAAAVGGGPHLGSCFAVKTKVGGVEEGSCGGDDGGERGSW